MILIKCDRCNNLLRSDIQVDDLYKITLQNNGYKTYFDICKTCYQNIFMTFNGYNPEWNLPKD